MYSVIRSFGLNGLNGFAVAVEADVSGGMPALSIVGLPDSAVRESGDRVHAAARNLGFKWPDRRITVNLAPADVRKTGPVYDLPLLLAVLSSAGQIEPPPEEAAFLGELALDGSLRPVSGVLPMALTAAASGVQALYVPAENAAEAAEACGDTMLVYPAHTALEVVDALRGIRPISPIRCAPFDPTDAWNAAPDFADVMGQPLARRAMVLAAAGGCPRAGALSRLGRSAARTTRPALSRWPAAEHSSAPASAVWPTAACCSWMSCRSSPARASKCSVSRWKTVRSPSAGPRAVPHTPAIFSWSPL
jgi:magnesium chelatase family protein